jgi:hypothetical protein
MIHVDFKLPADVKDEQWYKEWIARDQLKESWFEDWKAFRDKKAEEIDPAADVDQTELNRAVWGKVKGYLFALFHRKCGYCESYVEHISPGAVDHYRPKATYRWLAYEITNYIPSCTECNSGGKGAQFPVVGGRNATTPGAEKKERPQLLNPCDRAPDRDPSKHLHFISRKGKTDVPGFVKGLTREGKETIRLCGLNDRDLLVTLREQAQQNAVQRYLLKVAALEDQSPESIRAVIDEVCQPSEQYSAARRDAIANFILSAFQALGKTA